MANMSLLHILMETGTSVSVSQQVTITLIVCYLSQAYSCCCLECSLQKIALVLKLAIGEAPSMPEFPLAMLQLLLVVEFSIWVDLRCDWAPLKLCWCSRSDFPAHSIVTALVTARPCHHSQSHIRKPKNAANRTRATLAKPFYKTGQYQYVINISATVGFSYLDLDKNGIFNLLILGSKTDYNINWYFGVVNMLLEVLSAFGRGPS